MTFLKDLFDFLEMRGENIFFLHRGTHKTYACKDDLKLFNYDDSKVELQMFFGWSLYDLLMISQRKKPVYSLRES